MQQFMEKWPPIFYGTPGKRNKLPGLSKWLSGVDSAPLIPPASPNTTTNQEQGKASQRQIYHGNRSSFKPNPNNIPYNPKQPIAQQVATSFEVSLKNLHTTYLDSLVLHSPLRTLEATLEVWGVFEQLQQQGKVRFLGISNCYDLAFFKTLYEKAQVKPTFLQNRFYADSGYDVALREYCGSKNVHYQSFWTLTANPHVLGSPQLKNLAAKHSTGVAQVLYKSLIDEGVIPLIGTKSQKHMEQDLGMLSMKLSEQDKKVVWSQILKQ